MATKHFFISGNNNNRIPMYSWIPPDKPVAILYIVHGLAEYAERYEAIATEFKNNNIAVFANDIRGHGNAVSSSKEFGIVDDNWFNNEVEDLLHAINYIKKEYPHKKIFLLGHSMGSFLCQRFHQLYGNQINGLILSATNGKEDPMMNAGIAIAYVQMKLFGKNHRSKLLNILSFGKFNKAFKPNRTKLDWLSVNEANVDDYINDPKCGFICSSTLFYYFLKGLKDIFNPAYVKNIPSNVPVYLFAGDKDPVGMFGKGFLQLYENWKAIGIKDITYKLYKKGRHEMLHEINSKEVIDNVIDWIKNHL